MSTLVQLMPDLVELQLSVQRCQSTSFLIDSRNHLAKLRSLSIIFHAVKEIQRREIECLGYLALLRRLSITHDGNPKLGVVEGMDLDETLLGYDFEVLFSRLSQLQEVVFDDNIESTVGIMRMLGKHCLNLMYCSVHMEASKLRTLLAGTGVLFPTLKRLEIGNYKPQNDLTRSVNERFVPTAVLNNLMDMGHKEHAPRINTLYVHISRTDRIGLSRLILKHPQGCYAFGLGGVKLNGPFFNAA
ncbi:hypothetical protein K470DRAFT_47311 [Piedraia hortae CBS 480.64]|uniref:Uncharacterized protein n=1 Tax=Piedraia hortae CBS 480.64 TaxID=1314780 RepID=A0A6A7C2A5_9PEZI|nr:hypothetical protein K470DRAFT_47311 [Piedraia hortae CBS 480.64]